MDRHFPTLALSFALGVVAAKAAPPDVLDERVFVVYSDQDMTTGSFRVTIGLRTSGESGAPEGFHSVAVPETKFAVFAPEWEGEQTIDAAWTRIWSSNLPMASTYDLEVYELDEQWADIEEARIWVSLRE